MANANRPFGFRPSRYFNGAPYNGQTKLYGFSASMAQNCYKGDPVFVDTTNRSTALTDVYAPGIPVIIPAVAAITTTAFRGVVVGFLPQPEFNNSVSASLGLMYHVTSTAGYALVVDDLDVIFEAQEITGNAYTTAADCPVNKAVDISYVAGNTTTGVSKSGTTSTFTTSGVKPFRCLRLTQRVDNFGFAAGETNSYAKWDLLIANSDLAQANVGA